MMKRTLTYLIAMLVVVLAFPALGAQEKENGKKITGIEDLTAQTLCPVMGGEIDKEIFTDYQGQRVYFCCAWCIDKFKEDPEAVFKKTAEGKTLLENIQTVCPVSGDPIDKEYFRYYMGRGLYFCSEDCAAKFDLEPDKYLEKMDGEKDEDGKDAHGHKH